MLAVRREMLVKDAGIQEEDSSRIWVLARSDSRQPSRSAFLDVTVELGYWNRVRSDAGSQCHREAFSERKTINRRGS